MTEYKLGTVESQFADIVWENAPLSTGELVKRCEEALCWKRTTTYTVLKKLCEKGFFHMEDSTVTACISKEDYKAEQSEKFVEDTFEGSLPAFLTSFVRRKKLSEKEMDELQKVIEEMRR